MWHRGSRARIRPGLAFYSLLPLVEFDIVLHMTYYKKRSPNNPVGLSTGRGVRFEDFGNDTGYFKTEDSLIITEFKACMAAGRGGIQEVTQDEYDDAVKKKLPLRNYMQGFIREIQTSGLISVPLPQEPQAEVAFRAVRDIEVAKAAPVSTNSPEPKITKRVPKTQ